MKLIEGGKMGTIKEVGKTADGQIYIKVEPNKVLSLDKYLDGLEGMSWPEIRKIANEIVSKALEGNHEV